MKIYTVLYSNDMEGCWICGLFNDRKSAEDFVDKNYDEYSCEIEEWDMEV